MQEFCMLEIQAWKAQCKHPLLNKKLIHDASRIARTVQVMELSQIPEFEGVFIERDAFF